VSTALPCASWLQVDHHHHHHSIRVSRRSHCWHVVVASSQPYESLTHTYTLTHMEMRKRESNEGTDMHARHASESLLPGRNCDISSNQYQYLTLLRTHIQNNQPNQYHEHRMQQCNNEARRSMLLSRSLPHINTHSRLGGCGCAINKRVFFMSNCSCSSLSRSCSILAKGSTALSRSGSSLVPGQGMYGVTANI